jgi:Sec-independent protein translocase protein TatA
MGYSQNTTRLVSAFLILMCVGLLPGVARAQQDVIQFLKEALSDVNKKLDSALKRIDQLEKEKSTSAEEKSATVARVEDVEKSVQSLKAAPGSLNPAIGLVIDSTVDHRTKTGGNFNFRAAEIGIAASVDPYARAYSFITGTNDGIEVEEAAAVTSSLPWNITAKGGRFFADFGRYPKVHDHELPFVNRPLSIERPIGGESQANGVEVSYLFPTPFFLRGTVGGYNKVGAENDRVDNDRPRAWGRFSYLGRLSTYYDITDNHSIEVGSSLAYTPQVRVSDQKAYRALSGVDVTYRYQPLASVVYQGFTWGTEFLGNSECIERSSGCDRRLALGGYSYGEMKLNKSWSTGFLFDYSPSIASPGKKTIGYSPFLTWNISEFNRLRFQFTHADDHVRENKNDAGNQFFVQWTTVIGAHTHGFLSR